jgi:Flp pilus assembly protein TadB
MDDQRGDRYGSDLRASIWLNAILILALLLAACNHFVHAWDGGSLMAAALAVLDVTCIYVLSLNIARARKNN